MQLVTHHALNREFFKKGSRPSKEVWAKAVDMGEINGKIALGEVFIDRDDFLARDEFKASDVVESVSSKANKLLGVG